MHYLNPTQESGKRFYIDYHQKGEVVMLNLLKFNDPADYTDLDEIKPDGQVTGVEAYRLYMGYTMPYLKEAGSEVMFYGKCNHYLIGPESEKWDAVLIVKHQSVDVFMQFAVNQPYLKTAGHRTAALQDSRLLPMSDLTK